MAKRALLGIAGLGDGPQAELELQPGTTASQILRDAGQQLGQDLSRYVLSSGSSNGDAAHIFAPTENVYDNISEGQKLWATVDPKVGWGV